MDEQRTERLRNSVNYFSERKARAAARLAEMSGRHFYFALLGLRTTVEHYDFATIAKLQRVTEPPGEVELAAALKDKHLFGAIGRYSHHIRHELAVDRDFGATDQAAMNLGWGIVSALRVRSLAEFLVPVFADHSFSVIAAVADGACHAQLLEDVPIAKRLDTSLEVTEGDCDWVLSNLDTFGELLKAPKFRLAVECLTTHHLEYSERMRVATLWTGVEALFEVQTELRFRLATLIASVLEARGPKRQERYQRTKKLYDVRSKAVHGGTLPTPKVTEHVMEVRRLLSQLLCRFVELGKVPTEQELEELVFC